MVKRYDIDWTKYDGEAYMNIDPAGWYVRYDDYAELEAENARLREALREILEKTREALGDESA